MWKCHYCLIWLLSCCQIQPFCLDSTQFLFTVAGLLLEMARTRPRARLWLPNMKLKTLFLAPRLPPVKDRPSSTGAAQWGQIKEVREHFDNPYISHPTHILLTDGPGQAVISEGGAGGRGTGSGEARVNGMPGKKSNSTSKLSAKG